MSRPRLPAVAPRRCTYIVSWPTPVVGPCTIHTHDAGPVLAAAELVAARVDARLFPRIELAKVTV